MKPINIIFATLATVVIGACNAPQGETIVIEGRLTNVPDSMYFNLLEDIGKMLPTIDGDSVLNGEFCLEGLSENGAVNPSYILYAKTGLFTQHTLWTMPGAHIRITGDGLDYSNWKIESNVPAQKTENKLRANIRKELSEFAQAYKDYYKTGEKQYLLTADSLLLRAIPYKDLPLLETLPVDEAWINHMYYLSRSKDSALVAKGRELSQRMSEEQKATYYGKRLMTSLFPPKVVQIGDTIPYMELKDTLGNTHRLQELKGKYLLLDFWSSECSPCIKSFPELKEIAEQMSDSLEVVSISQDPEEIWHKASAKHHITWHNWNDLERENGIFAHFEVQAIPHYFLISPEGKLIASQLGYDKGILFEFVKENVKP